MRPMMRSVPMFMRRTMTRFVIIMRIIRRNIMRTIMRIINLKKLHVMRFMKKHDYNQDEGYYDNADETLEYKNDENLYKTMMDIS